MYFPDKIKIIGASTREKNFINVSASEHDFNKTLRECFLLKYFETLQEAQRIHGYRELETIILAV